METTLLIELIKVLGLAALVLLVSLRLHVPSMVGLLLTGVLIGPNGLGWVRASHDVEVLAEIGVVLLLFTIGLEFSIGQLNRLRRAVLIGGGVQVLGTIVLCALSALVLQATPNRAIFLGFMFALSSTAIVLKELQSRAQTETPHGQVTVSILIFQDMIVMGMILLTPVLGGEQDNVWGALGWALLKLAAVGLFTVVMARKVMPWLLYQVVRTRSRELFMLVIVTICMVTPWAGFELGLSVGLGAFIAGLIISDTDYSHQVLAGFMPMRDVFTSLFFVSIGMLLDGSVLLEEPLAVFGLALGLILLKGIIATAAVLLLRYPLRTALMCGIGLAQVGEFSFLLADLGMEHELVNDELFQRFIAATILTMGLTPVLIRLSPRVAQWAVGLPWPSAMRGMLNETEAPASSRPQGHVVIIGFGVSGRNLARSLRAAGIRYAVLEMNAQTVREEKRNGEPIYFGDAAQEAVMETVGVTHAKTLVVSLPDPLETRKITHAARRLNPRLHIVARTRFASEVAPLIEMGAGDVVADEFEASIELIARVLQEHDVPRTDTDRLIRDLRAGGYQCLRDRQAPLPLAELGLHRGELDIRTVAVEAGAALEGKSLIEGDLRRRHGLTVLAIRRSGELYPSPSGEMRIEAGDLIVLYGEPERLADIEAELRGHPA